MPYIIKGSPLLSFKAYSSPLANVVINLPLPFIIVGAHTRAIPPCIAGLGGDSSWLQGGPYYYSIILVR